MAGHSYGELVALAAAGVFSEPDLYALSEARGRFILDAAGVDPGTMAAIDADAGTVVEILGEAEGVNLANLNAPNQTVISGSRPAVEAAVARFAGRGIRAQLLPVACAFHSPIVAPARERLAAFLEKTSMREPRVTVFSNSTTAAYPEDPRAIAAQLAEHLVEPVEFVQEIEALYAAGARIFVEVGPRNVLSGLVDQILRDRARLTVPSDIAGRPGLVQLAHFLGQLAAEGVSLNLDALYSRRTVRRLDLARLDKDIAPLELPPTTWLINGGGSRPMKPAAPNAIAKEREAAPAKASVPKLVPVPVPERPMAPATPAVLAPAAAAAPADGATAQVMAQFQQLMSQFLETQESVMLAYLKGAPAPLAAESLLQTAIVPSVLPAPVLIASETAAGPVNGHSKIVPEEPETPERKEEKELPSAPPARAEAEIPDREQLTERLLAIVSERTGYPADMLSLDQDLEADLGVDSIKRVEILGNFQQSFSPGTRKNMEELMEKLAGVKTLGGIVDWVSERALSESQPKERPRETSAVAMGVEKEPGAEDEVIQRYVLTPVETP
jgi:acyl transferase domain-containing protein